MRRVIGVISIPIEFADLAAMVQEFVVQIDTRCLLQKFNVYGENEVIVGEMSPLFYMQRRSPLASLSLRADSLDSSEQELS